MAVTVRADLHTERRGRRELRGGGELKVTAAVRLAGPVAGAAQVSRDAEDRCRHAPLSQHGRCGVHRARDGVVERDCHGAFRKRSRSDCVRELCHGHRFCTGILDHVEMCAEELLVGAEGRRTGLDSVVREDERGQLIAG